ARGDRNQFRLLARHKKLIVPLIEQGTTVRRRLLLAIRAAKLANATPTLAGPFDLILADPPWQYDVRPPGNREIENEYHTCTLPTIVRHRPHAAADAVLFLWATAPKLLEALHVMKAWGFAYRTHAVWDKDKLGMGYWFRGRHELLLVGTKGSPATP